jgi:hypothetical protein
MLKEVKNCFIHKKPMLSRRNFAKAAAIGASLATGGCSLIWPRLMERPLTEGAIDRSGELSAGFVKGKTGIDDAINAMRQKGIGGITGSLYVNSAGTGVTALGADYQGRIFVFENETYAQNASLSYGGLGTPYAIRLLVGNNGGKTTILAFSKDYTAKYPGDKPPRLDVFTSGDDGFEYSSTFFLGQIAEKNNGIVRPLFVGAEIDEGVAFIARDNEGNVWGRAYRVSVHGSELYYKQMTFYDALLIPEIENYVYGGVNEELIIGEAKLKKKAGH